MLVVCIGDVLELEVFRVHKGDVTPVSYTHLWQVWEVMVISLEKEEKVYMLIAPINW